jgi:hypothetical protein
MSLQRQDSVPQQQPQCPPQIPPTPDAFLEIAAPVRCGPDVDTKVTDITRFAPNRATAKQSVVDEILRQAAPGRARTPCGAPACAGGATCAEVVLGVKTKQGGRFVIDPLDPFLEEREARYTDAAGALVTGVRLFLAARTITTTCECGQVA